MKNSFFRSTIASQLHRKQAGHKNAVKTMKNRLNPSIPIEKWIFQVEAHWISEINWYCEGEISFVKRIHRRILNKNVSKDVPRATSKARRTSCKKNMLITPRKGKIITDRRIVDPIFMFVGAACACPAPSATLVLRNRRAKSSEIGNYVCLAPMEKVDPIGLS